MNRRFIPLSMSAGAALVALLSFHGLADAQSAPAKGSGAIPRMADGKPDLSGVWAGPGFRHIEGAKYSEIPAFDPKFPRKDLPFAPGGEALWTRTTTGDPRRDDPALYCLPFGFPRVTLSAHAQQWVQGRDTLAILYEDMHFFRTIPLDGRPHPKDLELTWMGNSVGHWEGDTLVIDTVGLKAWTSDTAASHNHSDAAHYIERYQRTSLTTMTDQITTDDPKIFTKPWTSDTWSMHLHPEWALEEYVCEENNKDPGLVQQFTTPK